MIFFNFHKKVVMIKYSFLLYLKGHFFWGGIIGKEMEVYCSRCLGVWGGEGVEVRGTHGVGQEIHSS